MWFWFGSIDLNVNTDFYDQLQVEDEAGEDRL